MSQSKIKILAQEFAALQAVLTEPVGRKAAESPEQQRMLDIFEEIVVMTIASGQPTQDQFPQGFMGKPDYCEAILGGGENTTSDTIYGLCAIRRMLNTAKALSREGVSALAPALSREGVSALTPSASTESWITLAVKYKSIIMDGQTVPEQRPRKSA